MEVSEATLKSTTKCGRGFRCLSGSLYCSVVACMDDRYRFILCKTDIACPYKETFRGRTICACPTRGEINQRYRV